MTERRVDPWTTRPIALSCKICVKQKHTHTHTYQRQGTHIHFNSISFHTNVRIISTYYVESIHTLAQTIKKQSRHTVLIKVYVYCVCFIDHELSASHLHWCQKEHYTTPGQRSRKAAHHGFVSREKQSVPSISRNDVGSISSVWPCQGSKKRSILVEQRIKFKIHT